LEVGAEGVERDDQRARGSVGPEARVDRVERRAGAGARQGLEQSPNDLGDELLVGDRCVAAPGESVLVEEEDQVEVAVIIHLAASELAEADDRPSAPLAVAGTIKDSVASGPAPPLIAGG